MANKKAGGKSVTALVQEAGFDVANRPVLDFRHYPDGEDIEQVLLLAGIKMDLLQQLIVIVTNGAQQREMLFPLCWDWKDLPDENCAVVLIDKSHFDVAAKEVWERRCSRLW
jgi:hypothetical protein